MKTVVLITCTKNKHGGTHKAEYLYSKSKNFVKYLDCARALVEDKDIFVISALHKLVPLDKELTCYDYTLKGKSKKEKDIWGEEVATQLKELYDVSKTRFVIIAEDDYYTPLAPHLPSMDTPLEGVGCGPDGFEQLDAYIKNFTLEH